MNFERRQGHFPGFPEDVDLRAEWIQLGSDWLSLWFAPAKNQVAEDDSPGEEKPTRPSRH